MGSTKFVEVLFELPPQNADKPDAHAVFPDLLHGFAVHVRPRTNNDESAPETSICVRSSVPTAGFYSSAAGRGDSGAGKCQPRST